MSFKRSFMEFLCAQSLILYLLHIMSWVALVLNTIALSVAGPAGRTIALLNYIGLAGFIGGTGFVIWKCRQASPAPSPVDDA